MKLEGKKIGVVFTGSFSTFTKSIEQLKKIKKEKAEIIPIMSYNSYNMDTKFGKAIDFINKIEEISENTIIHTIDGAEPIGQKKMTDIMLVMPATRKYYLKACS